MLQGIRDRAQSWLMWVIVILIIIPFALWGIHEYFGGGRDVPIAVVNGKEIPMREFQQVLQQQRFRMQTSLGAAFDLDEAADRRLRRELLERMIEDEVLVQTSGAHGMAVSDEQLAALIHTLEPFRVDGRFSRERYETVLRSQGYVPAAFEQSFRRTLLTGQLQAGVTNSDFLTEPELQRLARLEGQTRTFRYLVIPASRFADPAVATDTAIQEYYASNGDRFVVPERVTVEYVELSLDELASAVRVEEEDLRQRYESLKSSYTTPEQRRARHILLSLPEDADAAATEAALIRARELRGRLLAGESFEELARAHSQDPGSAAQGGDLGAFGRGTMVGPFEDAVFAMQVGEVSEPVRSPFGVHVIRLDAVQPAEVRPLASVRETLVRELQRERAEPVYFEQGERLANLAFEHPDSLDPAARELGLTIRQAEPFGRSGGTGPASEPRFVAAAFADEVLQRGQNSEPLELRGGRVAVLRVKEHQAAAQRPLAEVRAEVAEKLVSQAARGKAEQVGRDALARLAAGDAPEALAGTLGAEWQEVSRAGRESPAVDPLLRRRVFQMARPQGDRPAAEVAELTNGDVAVVLLSAVDDGDAGAELGTLRQRIESDYGRTVYDAFVKQLRAGADVQTYADRLQE
jgi:peptidyl-prolyl cis-trans isomerase D